VIVETEPERRHSRAQTTLAAGTSLGGGRGQRAQRCPHLGRTRWPSAVPWLLVHSQKNRGWVLGTELGVRNLQAPMPSMASR